LSIQFLNLESLVNEAFEMKFSPFRLETSRLLVRSYIAADAPALFRMVSADRESLSDYFPLTVENNSSEYASRNFIQSRELELREGKSAFAGIFEKETGALIGQIHVKDINWRVPKCEMGYFIASPKRGNGFAAEALEAVADFCIRKAGMMKVMLRIENINDLSKRVAAKSGFTFSGTLKNDFRSEDGRLMDCEVWERIP
jgi:RimJ/RimL family protein N-acetyltransferase